MVEKKPRRRPRVKKLFVLDTNVLMHDPTCLFRFDEHDLYLPIATLEELDSHKRGLSDVSRNARQASRFLDEIVAGDLATIKQGLAIRVKDGQSSKGRRLPQDFWTAHGKDMESWKKEGHTYYRVRGPLVPKLQVNEFVYDEQNERPLYAIVREAAGRVAVLETLKDYTHTKNEVWGITARNRAQNFALNLLMNPEVD